MARLEAERLHPGAVHQALVVIAGFLRRPGTLLYVPWADCPCCDVVGARTTLQTALHGLPRRSRAELRVLVDRLDAELQRRTLPDPLAPAGPWWRRRLRDP